VPRSAPWLGAGRDRDVRRSAGLYTGGEHLSRPGSSGPGRSGRSEHQESPRALRVRGMRDCAAPEVRPCRTPTNLCQPDGGRVIPGTRPSTPSWSRKATARDPGGQWRTADGCCRRSVPGPGPCRSPVVAAPCSRAGLLPLSAARRSLPPLRAFSHRGGWPRGVDGTAGPQCRKPPMLAMSLTGFGCRSSRGSWRFRSPTNRLAMSCVKPRLTTTRRTARSSRLAGNV
jgi:hypothetical protein